MNALERLAEARREVKDAEAVVRAERIKERQERDAKEAMAIESHKAALASEAGLVGHPKLDRLYSLAWSHGHSSGFSEVASYFHEFAELLQP